VRPAASVKYTYVSSLNPVLTGQGPDTTYRKKARPPTWQPDLISSNSALVLWEIQLEGVAETLVSAAGVEAEIGVISDPEAYVDRG